MTDDHRDLAGQAAARPILLDLDGTLYEAGVWVPGALEAVERLRAAGHRLRFVTNTDSVPPAVLAGRLRGRGLAVADEELFTPVSAARQMLAASPHATVRALVGTALQRELGPWAAPDEAPATYVLVGDCRDTLDYPALDAAFRALRAGAELLALQRGRYFRAADGDHVDTGAVVAALEYAAGVDARVLGKPSAEFLSLAAASLGVTAADVVVVGDDATTDIAMAGHGGAASVQVRTGKFADQQRDQVASAAGHVVDSVAALPDLLA